MIISNYTVANPSHTDNIGVFINLSKFDIDNTTIALHGQKGVKMSAVHKRGTVTLRRRYGCENFEFTVLYECLLDLAHCDSTNKNKIR